MTSYSAIGPVNSGTNQPHEDWRTWWRTKIDDARLAKNALDLTAVLMDADSKRECLNIARSARIYERLFVFMFLHLFCYGEAVTGTDVLRTAQATWDSWTECQLLTSHCIVRDTVLQCSQSFSADRELFGISPQRMIDLDIDDIQNKILSSLKVQAQKKALFNHYIDNPTSLLNLLQDLLDRNGPSCENNILLARAIARLSKSSGCYPDCLILSDVRRTGVDPVGGGGFADVWKGDSGGRPVALKALRIFDKASREAALKEFSHEATIWRQLVHPNILPFYGVFKGDDSFDRLCLVSPWMGAGTASMYLAAHPNADRISLLADVAKGLDYLHLFVTPIVHGDLKGANIFVTSNLTACLGDFGLAHFKDSVDSTLGSTTGHTTGTLRWQAPELFQRGEDGHASRPSRETDSYSFGCVCLELMTGSPPFIEIRTDFAVLTAIMNHETPRRPSIDLAHRGLDVSLWALIEKCWNRNPNLRPTSKDLVEYFNVRITAPHHLLASDSNVQVTDPISLVSQDIISEKHSQPFTDASLSANTSTHTNGLSANYQPPGPKRQSTRLLVRSLAATAAQAHIVVAAANDSSTIDSPAVSKRPFQDRSLDFTPSRKRFATGRKRGNVSEATNLSQTGGTATTGSVCGIQNFGSDETLLNVPSTFHLKACDDKDGHYNFVPRDMMFQRYLTVRLLRQDLFGRVVEAFDTVNEVPVAIKIIRSIPKCREVGETEIRVLQKLKEHNQDIRNKCIRLLDWFDHQSHICLVSELLEISIYDFLRDNHFQPFPRKHIQDFAQQLFGSVAFLHDLHLSHTDLKPESILLVKNSYRIVCDKRKKPQKRILNGTEIRLTDFGSAAFESEYHSNTNSTRHYRAPEITLGLRWSYSCDVFSLGCILVEFSTGVALFQTHDNLTMMETMGRAQRSAQSATHNEDKGFHSPKSETSTQSEKDMKWRKNLEHLIPPKDPVNQLFLDLLVQMLAYDPAQRISVRDALEHSYFTLEIPMEDF